MGYMTGVLFWLAINVSFNSLYGIQHLKGYQRLKLKHFQFPLWDTAGALGIIAQLLFFQFPLWDTLLMQVTILVTIYAFNSLYGIQQSKT